MPNEGVTREALLSIFILEEAAMSIRTARPIVLGLTVLAGFAITHLSVQAVLSQDSGSSAQVRGATKTAVKYLGCYADRQDRDLQGTSFTAPDMTTAACQAYCGEKGFLYAGTQYSSQCFCGNSFGKYGLLPESRCDMGCSGNPGEKCGGFWANSVYSLAGQGFTKAILQRILMFSEGFVAHYLVSLLLAVGLLASLMGFVSGFRVYRELRLFKGTPQASIRSIPMGFVHVHGKITVENPLTSPLTQIPCSYYRTKIERWESGSGKNPGHWKEIYHEQDEKEFYLDDGTGRALVNPQGAEYLLPELFQVKISPKALFGGGGFGKPRIDPSLSLATSPSEQYLRDYLAKHGIREVRIGYLLTEYCLLVDHEYSLFGTYVENSEPKNPDDRKLLQKGKNERTFVITALSERNLEGWEGCRAIAWIAGSAVFAVFFLVLLLVRLHLLK